MKNLKKFQLETEQQKQVKAGIDPTPSTKGRTVGAGQVTEILD